jgi:integrase
MKSLPKQKDNPMVFWQFSDNALSVALSRAIKRAGLSDFRLHDLRHSFATEIRQRGYGIDLLQKLLGHSDPRMTQRYTHLGDDMLIEAADSIKGLYSTELPPEDETQMVH